MAEKLIVKNFGPLKDIDIELKDVNVFIGPTSSGKSTLAKLLAIFRNLDFFDPSYSYKEASFDKYSIQNFLMPTTYMNYVLEDFSILYENMKVSIVKKKEDINTDSLKIILKGNKLKQSLSYAEDLKDKAEKVLPKNEYAEFLESLSKIKSVIKEIPVDETIKDLNNNVTYIPAERSFISMVANSLFSLINSDVSLSRSFKDFGANFEKARNELKELTIDMLAVKYKFENNINKVYLENDQEINLELTSSGMQALLPMMLVVEYFSKQTNSKSNYFVVEEPELNLYPTMQKALVEFLIERCTKNNNKLIITTHSPYILTALDNLIQAKNVVDEKPHLKDEVAKLVPEQRWLDFNRVSAYYVADGTARSILDNEMKSIGANKIDDVSENLGSTFDQLLNLRFQES